MNNATSLFLQGFTWGCGASCLVCSMMAVWGAFCKTTNSI